MEQFAEDSEFLLARKNLNLNLANSWRHKHGGHGGFILDDWYSFSWLLF